MAAEKVQATVSKATVHDIDAGNWVTRLDMGQERFKVEGEDEDNNPVNFTIDIDGLQELAAVCEKARQIAACMR